MLKRFYCFEADFDKLDINRLVNVPNILYNLKAKVDNLDVSELKTVPIVLKKLSYVVKNQVVKNTKFNKKFLTRPI